MPTPQSFALQDRSGELEAHRRELTGYCYRMLGSGFEAEDAVQETMVRAWRGLASLESRAAMRSWLYRIATNVCLDMLQRPQRRARPMDFGPASTADGELGVGLPESTWVQPIADARVLPADVDPAELTALRETVRLAFVAALQHLPPKQRAVLVLREVLHLQASEVAELLDTSVASVNSALQRARATLQSLDLEPAGATNAVAAEQEELLAKYVDAFEAYDVDRFVSLLKEDAEFSMPPWSLWLEGPDQVARWLVGQGAKCEGSKLLPTWANGGPAFGHYHPTEDPKVFLPWALVVVELDGDRVAGIHNFVDAALFPEFGLPERLELGA
ncbi:sigma-70 family RNA polymerase sigma factor [Conexibacter sp. SYSU D00693]|uniref:sigma-70 family RNA polymerase sigma factor n=1 Tax=Conexibacter sp. SYSU D00693 TaxID=2812560 RepID=UPI00196AEF72|nr:sigma-70 family RNA polymerase sigma factor [Conexibacter sp. SYSU D00693]